MLYRFYKKPEVGISPDLPVIEWVKDHIFSRSTTNSHFKQVHYNGPFLSRLFKMLVEADRNG
ncbi:hypothetical protein [Desertivirga arenae]|uniref:hypothetical protein n=1 Tax=Desertivirga arenae TaxID=2810309 RepID=UPI001A9774F0|nr:hypothetical protein [Pedobacter sp. SYSU D00823]